MKWHFILAALLLLAATPAVQPSELPEQPQTMNDRFERAVSGWVAELSGQPGFEQWKEAEWTRQPLGPGMHGWIVTLTAEGRSIGYLVVAADPRGGLRLAEYGRGEYPLFDEQTLHRALVRHELIDSSVSLQQFVNDPAVNRERYYADAFRSLWLIDLDGETYRFEAKSGELLPNGPGMSRKTATAAAGEAGERETATVAAGKTGEREAAEAAGGAGEVRRARYARETHGAGEVRRARLSESAETHPRRLAESVMPGAFDPYYNLAWMDGEPEAMNDPRQLADSLDGGNRWICVVDLYGGAAAFAYAVVGYHRWEGGETYIALDQCGPRFIPADIVVRSGKFHRAGAVGEPIWRD